ncbi:SCO3242 family prenyltransferase [Arthrobacter sp. L77]|uniref:SCO3242 family prenyltransferase n=1 Tax=Arthrobacter sp. L77 TaxID=1496689 RepID=UPI0005B8315A|nr:UbiA family prenyltransferase [Arthrobacter sp. L77]
MADLGTYLELVRAPAVLTVLGDSLVGHAAAGSRTARRRRSVLLLPAASACLYAAGMALNDFADRDLDAEERPERPIPSGRVSARRAFGLGASLSAVGLALAAAAGGRRALGIALPLTLCIWTYDLVAKPHPVAGPLLMGGCRGLDVLLGAGTDGAARAAGPALAMAAHTVGVTALSRGEVHGTSRPLAAGVSAATTLTTVLVASRRRAPSLAADPLAIAGALAYALRCLPAQWSAVAEPSGPRAREATKQGIRAMVPLQTALVLPGVRGGRVGAAAFLAAVDLAGALLRTRRRGGEVSET